MNIYVVRQATQGLANWVRHRAGHRLLPSVTTAVLRAMYLRRQRQAYLQPTN